MGPGMVAKLGRIKLVTRKKVRPSSVFRIGRIRIPKAVSSASISGAGSLAWSASGALPAVPFTGRFKFCGTFACRWRKETWPGSRLPSLDLEIVALVKNFSDQPVSRRRIERFVRGQKRRFSGTRVGKDKSRHLLARI